MKLLLPADVEESDPRVGHITLEHLATHTSGLPRMPVHALSLSRMWRFVIAADSYRDYTDDDILETISEKRLRHAPGERYAYSNVGFGALGLALSRQAEADFHHLVESSDCSAAGIERYRSVSKPLAARSTGYGISVLLSRRVVLPCPDSPNLGSFRIAWPAQEDFVPQLMICRSFSPRIWDVESLLLLRFSGNLIASYLRKMVLESAWVGAIRYCRNPKRHTSGTTVEPEATRAFWVLQAMVGSA